MNQVFIDGQNLIMGTKMAERPWAIDWRRFRTFLREKYNGEKVYYFIGAYDRRFEKLYNYLKEDDYIVVFREHSEDMSGSKKGNVDTDIVFTIMKKLIEKEELDKIILVSGDGDYFRMVKYLIDKNRFGKLLAPNRAVISSLYRRIPDSLIGTLDDVRIKVGYRKK